MILKRLVHPIGRYLLSPYTDPDRKASTGGDSVYALDGLRGVAVLVVIASHTNAFGMTGQGSLGVLLFFALSGFLLTLPFRKDPRRMLDTTSVWRFAANRFLRIVPLYVAAVAYMYWYLGAGDEWLTSHLTFQVGWNHFWSVVEEARFYVLFPIVIAALAIVPSLPLRIGTLLILILIAYRYQSVFPVDMTDGNFVQFYFWFFLGGMLCAFIAPAVPKNQTTTVLFNAASLLVLAALFLSSDAMVAQLWGPAFPPLSGISFNGWHRPVAWCALFSTLLVTGSMFQESFASRIMQSWTLRHIGLLSFSLYLFHIPVMILLRPFGFQENGQFVATLAATYVLALFTYVVIEKPFLMLKPKGRLQKLKPQISAAALNSSRI